MTSPTVDRLIARLESASEGSRKLDALVYIHRSGWKTATAVNVCGGDYPGSGPWGQWVILRPTTPPHIVMMRDFPDYTTSLDAALTLVPEGWGFKADCGLGYGNAFTVGHVGPNKLFDQPEGWGKAATPALALCIAALQARQISQRETGAPL